MPATSWVYTRGKGGGQTVQARYLLSWGSQSGRDMPSRKSPKDSAAASEWGEASHVQEATWEGKERH